MLAASDANLLVLDEPTNHLDLWSREALEKAIREFDGTVLLVTHDRYLVNAVADHVVVMRSGRTSIIDGNYDSYRNWIQAGNVVEERGQAWSTQGAVGSNRAGGTPAKPNADSSNKTNGSDRKNSSSDPQTNTAQSAPTKRKRKYPYKKVEVLEREIAEAEQSLEEMMQQSLDPNVLRDGPRIKQLHAEIANVQLKIEQLYEHYEEAVELN
jgi:ATP-binding cassette subfamily F protein 3